jgi:hypothetical protein
MEHNQIYEKKYRLESIRETKTLLEKRKQWQYYSNPSVIYYFRQFPCSKGSDFDAPDNLGQVLVGEMGDRLAPKYI